MSSSEDGDDPPQDYNDTHRALLQVFLSRPTLTHAEAAPILAAILSAHGQPTHAHDVDAALFRTYVHALNGAVSGLDYEVRHAVHQADEARTPVYALVNTTSDPQTQLATGLSADEVAFVKRVIDAMFDGAAGEREVFAVKATEALGLAKVSRLQQGGRDSGVGLANGDEGAAAAAGNVSSITMAKAEEVLEQMCEQGWFEKSAAGYIGLGTRGLMELNGWLREMYDEPEEGEDGKRIRDCGACKDIVTVGQRCSNHVCGFRLHNFCVQRLFHSINERRCPKCKSDWTGQDPVGEKAARGNGSGSRRSNGARQSNANSRRSTTFADEEDQRE